MIPQSACASATAARRLPRDAFSLVEVVVAIGVVAFVLIAIFSLTTVSLKVNRDAVEQMQAANILTATLRMRRAFPFETSTSTDVGRLALGSLSNASPAGVYFTNWVNASGQTTTSNSLDAAFRVLSQVTTNSVTRSSQVFLRMEWPVRSPVSSYEVATEILWP